MSLSISRLDENVEIAPENETLPMVRTIGFGLQHVLAMFGGVISVPLLIGQSAALSGTEQAMLVSCALLMSGLATFLQAFGAPFFGSRLPVVQGVSFASVSTIIAIVQTYGQGNGRLGLGFALGACLVAGVIAFLVVPLFVQVLRLFPPLVTGCVVTVIGLSLLPAAGGWIVGSKEIRNAGGAGVPNPAYADPRAVLLALGVLALVLALNRTRLRRLAILLGLVIGTLVSIPLGMAGPFSVGGRTGVVSITDVVGVPLPLQFGLAFDPGAIVSMLIVLLVIMVETTADIVATAQVTGAALTTRRVADGLRSDMALSAVAPLLNTFSLSAFAQNVGLVALTRVRSRYTVAAAGVILVLLGLSPILAALIKVIPNPVLGGVGIALFGSVTAAGIQTLSRVSMDGGNLLIVAVSIAFGLLPKISPDIWSKFPGWFQVTFGSGISACAIVAVLLNVLFNGVARRRTAE